MKRLFTASAFSLLAGCMLPPPTPNAPTPPATQPLHEWVFYPTEIRKNTCPGKPRMEPVSFSAAHIGQSPVTEHEMKGDGNVILTTHDPNDPCFTYTSIVLGKYDVAALTQARNCPGYDKVCSWMVMGEWH